MALFGIQKSKDIEYVEFLVDRFLDSIFWLKDPKLTEFVRSGKVKCYANHSPKWTFAVTGLTYLKKLKNEDYMVYRVILQIYENDIKEAVRVCRESRN